MLSNHANLMKIVSNGKTAKLRNRHVISATVQSPKESKHSVKYEVLDKPKPKLKPGNVFTLAGRNFISELLQIGPDLGRALGLRKEADAQSAPRCFDFTLSNRGIREYELDHPAPGKEDAPVLVEVLYNTIVFLLDNVFENRAVERFWLLETVARMPYFAYSSCLHLYETLGWWRTAELRKIHFAEEWNEMHHLLIMETLGGNARWSDRFLAYHAAIVYYWILVVCYLFSPKTSYKFSEMLETHAVSTYRQFLIENKEKLKQMPAPEIAVQYYSTGDLYLFHAAADLARAATGEEMRRPPVDNMYDIFSNILEDEWEHVKTMVMCQDYETLDELVGVDSIINLEETDQPNPGVRAKWKQWADSMQSREASFFT